MTKKQNDHDYIMSLFPSKKQIEKFFIDSQKRKKKMTTYNEYQTLTAETAVYPEQHAASYLLLGLGEIGEIQGKIKKIIRDDNSIVTDEKRKEISKELGDFLWYFAQYTKLCGFSLADFFDESQLNSDLKDQIISKDESPLNEPAFMLGLMVGTVQCLGYEYRFQLENEGFKVAASETFVFMGRALLVLCFHLQLNIEDVMQENLDKLQSRKERGKLQGSGDNR